MGKVNRTLGAVLIVLIGLLNFHPPHFPVEHHHTSAGGSVLEVALLADVLAACLAAVGIVRSRRWGRPTGGRRHGHRYRPVRGTGDGRAPRTAQDVGRTQPPGHPRPGTAFLICLVDEHIKLRRTTKS